MPVVRLTSCALTLIHSSLATSATGAGAASSCRRTSHGSTDLVGTFLQDEMDSAEVGHPCPVDIAMLQLSVRFCRDPEKCLLAARSGVQRRERTSRQSSTVQSMRALLSGSAEFQPR